MQKSKNLETATLAGGCFWCTGAVFRRLKGVTSVVSGYSGGTVKNPGYEQVCTGTTGHAEAIQIEFDPKIISFGKLLKIFFKLHDPTTLNRQGNDVGTQYRSSVFYHNKGQKNIALKVKDQIEKSGMYHDRIVTQITPVKNFYKAEDYHQNYFETYKNQPYCQLVIDPKITKLYKEFKEVTKD